jgi:hypothetical protein
MDEAMVKVLRLNESAIQKVTCGRAQFQGRGTSRRRLGVTHKVPPVPGLLFVINGQEILGREEELGMAEAFRVVGLEPFDDRLGFGHVGEVAGVTGEEKKGLEWCVDDPERLPRPENLLGVTKTWCEGLRVELIRTGGIYEYVEWERR